MSQPEVPDIATSERKLAEELDRWKDILIERNRIFLRERLDRGGFGEVWIADLDPQDVLPRKVAVKKLVPRGEKRDRLHVTVSFARELKVWAVAKHPNILPLIGFYLNADAAEALFVSPFECNGNIGTYLQKANPDLAKRMELAIDTAEGLAYLHNFAPAPICHGDIKPDNVLINGELRAMLCDFGLATVVEKIPSGLTTTGFANAKTQRYQSFELFIIDGARRNLKTDIWAWAALLLVVLADRHPYDNCNDIQVLGQLTKRNLPAPVEDLEISRSMKQLLMRCWDENPDARPNMDQCAGDLRLELYRVLLGPNGAPLLTLAEDGDLEEGGANAQGTDMGTPPTLPVTAPKRRCCGICTIQ